MPPAPGEPEKRELYQQVGRAIVELSNAENLLAVIFCVLSLPVSLETAKEMFASQGGFEKKLRFVNFMVLRANRSKEVETWKEIYKELNTHRGVRNLIAHQRMIVSYSGETPSVDVSLTPLFYKDEGKVLRTSEIKATADELASIKGKLLDFVMGLDKPS